MRHFHARAFLRRAIHMKPWQMRAKCLLPSRREASAVLLPWWSPGNKKWRDDRTASAGTWLRSMSPSHKSVTRLMQSAFPCAASRCGTMPHCAGPLPVCCVKGRTTQWPSGINEHKNHQPDPKNICSMPCTASSWQLNGTHTAQTLPIFESCSSTTLYTTTLRPCQFVIAHNYRLKVLCSLSSMVTLGYRL